MLTMKKRGRCREESEREQSEEIEGRGREQGKLWG